MIAGIFHQGSGLGDQLMRYITVRTLAEEKGYEWGMMMSKNFKGDFLNLEIPEGKIWGNYSEWVEKEVRDENGVDIRSYDPEINFVQDNTIIDGCFEDFQYWGHNLDNIRKWLAVEPLKMPDDVCAIGFRGGEYATNPDLFLGYDYWVPAIEKMRKINPQMKFQVHTDDKELAKNFFKQMGEDFECIQDIALNWRSVRYAQYLIIANSAFYILPSLLNQETATIIAPRYWARHNTKTWARPACYYKRFKYI